MQADRATVAAIVANELQLFEAARGGRVLFHGNSMLPLLRDGDSLLLEPVDWASVRPGDIVTYRLEERFPTLRVLRKRRSYLLLGADNWPGRRFRAWPEHLLGRVVARTREGRTLAAGSPAWRARTAWAIGRNRAGAWAFRTRRRARVTRERWRARGGERYAKPPNVQINVSSNCNLRCRMCPYLHIHPSAEYQEYMSAESFERLLPVVAEVGAVHVSGSGEPMFNKELPRILARIREAAPRAEIALTTNATMMTRRMAQALIDARVSEIHVSFDGLPGSVEAIRVGVNSGLVVENVRRLAQLEREQGVCEPRVQINYMTGYGTYWQLVEFLRLAREIGVERINLLTLQPKGAADVGDDLLRGLDRDGGAALKHAIMLAEAYDIRLILPFVGDRGCDWPYNPHIGEDGEVYPCCFLDYDGRQELHHEGRTVKLPSMSFGNALRQPFDEIWSSRAYTEFRTRTARGDFTDFCQTCFDVRHATSERVKKALGLG